MNFHQNRAAAAQEEGALPRTDRHAEKHGVTPNGSQAPPRYQRLFGPFSRRNAHPADDTAVATGAVPATTGAAGATGATGTQRGWRRNNKVHFFVEWLKYTWIDIATILVIGIITLALFLSSPVGGRRFPISYPMQQALASGQSVGTQLVDPSLAYPYREWTVPSWLVAILGFLIPVIVIALFQLRIHSLWDLTNGVMGSAYAIIIGECTHVFLKTIIGGFRPHFLAVCDPDPAKFGTGTGYGNIYFSTDICRGKDKDLLKQAMTSFPSGHAVCAFAGLGFLFFYLNGKLKPWSNYRPMAWEIAATLLPLLGALLLACSVLVNANHHGHDVVVGGVIGFLSAMAVYRTYYAAIWDWRFNHIPMKPLKLVEYDLAREENLRRVVFKKGFWHAGRAGPVKAGPGMTTATGANGVGNGIGNGHGHHASHGVARRGHGVSNGHGLDNGHAHGAINGHDAGYGHSHGGIRNGVGRRPVGAPPSHQDFTEDIV